MKRGKHMASWWASLSVSEKLKFIRRRALAYSNSAKKRRGNFWSHVEKTGSCWLWKRGCSKNGYGIWEGRGAHRVAWEKTHRQKLKRKEQVCHHCDNPPCVRPDHLFKGSNLDNARDAARKGRMGPKTPLRGENNPGAKLTRSQVEEIRRLRGMKVARREVAARFNVTEQTVYRITNGSHWKR